MILQYNYTLKILIFSSAIILFSCKTNKVPDGDYLFTGSKFSYLDKKGSPYLNQYGSPYLDKKGKSILNPYKKPYEDELEAYVKQKPNKNILFFIPLPLWIYDLSNPKFDSVYSEYYKKDQKKRNQKYLDSLYVKYHLNSYLGKTRWLDRFFYHNGEPPIIVDTTVSKKTAQNLQQFFINRGWKKAQVTDTIETNNKKAAIVYSIKLNRPMTVDTLIYNIAPEIKNNFYNSYTKYITQYKINHPNKKSKSQKEKNKEQISQNFFLKNVNIKSGDRVDSYIFGDQITKLENLFKNLGYYGFNDLKDEVIFYVDTAKSDFNVPVTLQIKKSNFGLASTQQNLKKDSIQPRFKRYSYKNIKVILDDFEHDKESRSKADSTYYISYKKIKEKNLEGKNVKRIVPDTIAYIINKSSGRYKNRVLADIIAMHWGQHYRINSELETRRNIYKVNNFNILGFNTRPVNETDSLVRSTIILTPMEKYSYELGFEAFTSKVANIGISPNITFTTKNVFRGAENLSIRFGGTLGNIDSKKNNNKLFNASEFSSQVSLSFPRLLVPFNMKSIVPKSWGPSSAISGGYNAQYNIGLDKRNYTTALSYNVTPTRTTVHQISLLNIQYTQFLNPSNYFNIYTKDNEIREKVFNTYFIGHSNIKDQFDRNQLSIEDVLKIIQRDEDFQYKLENNNPSMYNDYNLMEARRYRFTQNILISSFKYDFTYDQRLGYFPHKNPIYLKTQLEVAGNVISIFNKGLKDFETSNGKTVKQIFGIPYSQFIKIDFDIRKYWKFSGNKSFNARLFTGVGIPYGNSFDMPFDRSYSVGGPSDVRAWRAFGFGPGDSKLSSKDGYELTAIDNFKLLSSIEYRFPLPSKNFEGALFVDAGNVWGINKHSKERFELDSFYKELGIGGGWGIRWNISNFIIRFDFAYKFHDPKRNEGDRWCFDKINLLKPQFNFAIDYPF